MDIGYDNSKSEYLLTDEEFKNKQEQLMVKKSKLGKKILICCGLVGESKKPCTNARKDGEYFCRKHIAIFKDFYDGDKFTKEIKWCSRGRHLHFDQMNTCDKHRTMIINEQKRLENKIIPKEKCIGFDRKQGQCRNLQKYGKFCKLHKYLENVNEREIKIENFKRCSSCINFLYKTMFEKDYKTCKKCSNIKAIPYSEIYKRCAHPECRYSAKLKNNKYCENHQKYGESLKKIMMIVMNFQILTKILILINLVHIKSAYHIGQILQDLQLILEKVLRDYLILN
jgi:hypothetical protein